MKNNFTVTFNGMQIRSLAESDIERLRVLRNEQRDCFLDNSIITPEMQQKWYRKYLLTDFDYLFAIETTRTIGFFALYNYEPKSNSYEFGRFVIDPEASGKGNGSTALICALAICFSQLGASSVRLEVLANNKRAIHVYEKIGLESTDSAIISGSIHMSISKRQYLERYANVYTSIEAKVSH